MPVTTQHGATEDFERAISRTLLSILRDRRRKSVELTMCPFESFRQIVLFALNFRQ
jgi:hypothetical protein